MSRINFKNLNANETIHEISSFLLGPSDSLIARWLFLRALGAIFFSAFYSLLFQIDGLIGPDGILPAREYLEWLKGHMGIARFWLAPSLYWFGSSSHALQGLCWAGLAASVLLFFNIWPRAMIAFCTAAFLSFVSVAREFSSYQSDGMLLEAGFICLFFAPAGMRPGWGPEDPPSRLSLFLLQWEWFRIYFESGVVKLLSGDPHWRHFTAMDDYYQNGPLPTWIGWYVQQLPHGFHAGVTAFTLFVELVVVWMLFLPRRFRIICFWILLPFQISIILTANYAFLNYIVLCLSVLLLDDGYIAWISSRCTRGRCFLSSFFGNGARKKEERKQRPLSGWRGWVSVFFLGWILYDTTALLVLMLIPQAPLPLAPIGALEPFRFANRYGLFAVMTPARYEIEFQGSYDGKEWKPYPFRYKPQKLDEAPGIYAPYQPRFDWNLWFASLQGWRQNLWVVHVQGLLLENSPAVLKLFRDNPFSTAPPKQVRSVYWQYWFTDLKTKRIEGNWWRRQFLGLYGPTLGRSPEGKIIAVAVPK